MIKGIAIICLVSFLSCKKQIGQYSNDEPSTYEISLDSNISNSKAVFLSKIGNKIEYIPLETISSSLLQSIDQIELCDTFIFVSDRRKLIQFNKTGKFIRQIGSQGRGPGEFIYIRDFCIDENTRLLYILNSGSKQVIVYNFKGEFIKVFDLPTQQSQIILQGENSLMIHVPNVMVMPNDTALSWIITSREGSLQKIFLNGLKRTSFPGYIVPDAPALYNFNKKVFFMEYGIDTLYTFKDKNYSKSRYVTFNSGNLKMDPDPLLNSIEVKEQLSDKFWIYSVIEQKDFFFIRINWGLSLYPVNCFFDKKTKEVNFPENGAFINNIDGGPDFWPRQIINDSIFIGFPGIQEFVKDTEVTSKELKKLKESLNETSNPVIMILYP